MIKLVTRKNQNQSGEVWRSLTQHFPGASTTFQFKGRGQQATPVAPLKTLLMVVHAIQGKEAIRFRILHCEQMYRDFASDLKPEVELVDNQFLPAFDHTTSDEHESSSPKGTSSTTIYSLYTAQRFNGKTSLYIRIRKPEEMLVPSTYVKQMTKNIIKFGLAACLLGRGCEYDRLVDNGYFAFSFHCEDRHQAEIIERMMIYEFSTAAVLGSREYVDVADTAELLGCTYVPGSYSSYFMVAQKLFLRMVQRIHTTWPSSADSYGYSYNIIADNSTLQICSNIIDQERAAQMGTDEEPCE